MFVNRVFEGMTGYTVKELIGSKMDALVSPDDRDEHGNYVRGIIDGTRDEPCKYRIINRKRQTVWVSETVV